MASSSYRLLITRSVVGHFFWVLIGANGKRLAESHMLSSKDRCMHIVKPLSKKLNAPIDFLDLEKDCEE